ncbi:hypothetical protein MMC11_000632 [Xylographa trunciseda]|nr:hypothetical protein [Xylographa trunciseda]
MGSTTDPITSTSTPSLPLIDISPFLSPSSPTSALTACATSLSTACTTHGFFYLTHHNLPPALTARVLSLARTFFTTATPLEKRLITRQAPGHGYGDGARGYQPPSSNLTAGKRDAHEAIDWYRPIVLPAEAHGLTGKELTFLRIYGAYGLERLRQRGGADGPLLDAQGRPLVLSKEERGRTPPFALLRGVNLWPDRPSEFRDVYEVYVREMLALGEVVLRAMGWALGLGEREFFVEKSRESFWVMRAIGYPPLPKEEGDGGEGGISCGEHTDYGCLTLLLADETRGALQVQARGKGERWIAADPVEGALVVNIGDMMERWTNGLWRSTRHRVVHRGDGYRVSVPFFVEPDFEARVSPLEECVARSGGMERWGEVVYGEHLLGKVGGNFYEGEDEGEEK